jgi:uncharacterized membrane protein (DUF2068 family)
MSESDVRFVELPMGLVMGDASAVCLPRRPPARAVAKKRLKLSRVPPAAAPPLRRDRGVEVIILYKAVKGGLWLVLATTIAVLVNAGLADRVVTLAEALRDHARPWSVELAKVLLRASSRHALWTVVAALYADGTVTLVEGWALYHGRWWGPWLVVGATGALLPFEVASLVRHPRPIRIVLLLVNLAIVVYLARVASRHGRPDVTPPPPDAPRSARRPPEASPSE